jgi:hypothetical protein
VNDMHDNIGEVPHRTTEIKAQKRTKPVATESLDVDTRISTKVDGPSVKMFDQEVV